MNKREVKGVLIAKGFEDLLSDETYNIARAQVKNHIKKMSSYWIAEEIIKIDRQKKIQHHGKKKEL